MISETTVQLVISLGLVDETWYRRVQHLPNSTSVNAHFLIDGWSRGCAPNPFFDPAWYVGVNPNIRIGDALAHYLEIGEAEGLWPCRLLDPVWYAERHGVRCGGGSVLAHFFRHGVKVGLQPNSIFDASVYLDHNPDLPKDKERAATHYLEAGYREQRIASSSFDGVWYRRHNLNNADEDPIYHYLTIGQKRGYPTAPRDVDSAAKEVRRFAAPGPHFEALDSDLVNSAPAQAKIITFYLPQFHAIPENDDWWGTGFTEWRNVGRGQPRFVGHHQPRLPRDLGFYDLSDPHVMRRQVELAKAAGVYGFCFYYYQFGQRQVLDKPLKQLLSDPSIDIPFSLLWANENWTRRWDGQEVDVLLEQDYAEANDEHLIANVAAAMHDKRYIRVGGRPLFFVYRPGIIPGMRERVVRWRKLFREQHGLEPWLLMAQTFNDHDPTPYGLDGAVEFPPHKVTPKTPTVTHQVSVLDPEFSGAVYDYNDIVATSLNDPEPSYPLIKTAFPSWDNDARRQGHGTSVINSTPAAYQRWLEALIARARRKRFAGEALVFVNAWNEWAEGAYLEPDVHFGSAYLNATARAVTKPVIRIETSQSPTSQTDVDKPHVLLVGHDAHEHGAQMVLLNLGRTFVEQFGVKVTFLLLGPGAMVPRYQEIGETIVTSRQPSDIATQIERLHDRGIQFALTNTVVTGDVVPHLRHLGIRVLSLVHELPRIIAEHAVEEPSRAIAQASDVVVFPAELVRDAFKAEIAPITGRALILPQGLYANAVPLPDSRSRVRAELGLPQDARIVLGVGYADLRKGVDLFFETARAAAASDPGLIFVWVGRLEPAVSTWIVERDSKGALPANVRHVPFSANVSVYLQYIHAADVFYLTSREDPFPSTVLDALACGIPVVGFAGRTGAEGLIKRFGSIIPAYDTTQALRALSHEMATQTPQKIEARIAVVASEFSWTDYAFRLLQELNPAWQRISVVVPNYNYARYLEERLDSIFHQTVPVYEIIVLDDASSDDSLAVLERIKRERGRTVRVVANAANSGSIMKQWTRAASDTSGDFLWIAEADDLAEPAFLQRLVASFDPSTLMAFSDSAQIDDKGQSLAPSYGYYFRRFHATDFEKNFKVEASAFASRYLSKSNIILNVSSVLFRREPLLKVLTNQLSTLQSFRFAGDWLTYLMLCRQNGKISFCAKSLNVHRRHGGSATHQTALNAHVAEVTKVHDEFVRLFGANKSTLASQLTYRDELREQFGLTKDETAGIPKERVESV
jgi:glycosyltransferase involved in cell wall biosynthesis